MYWGAIAHLCHTDNMGQECTVPVVAVHNSVVKRVCDIAMSDLCVKLAGDKV